MEESIFGYVLIFVIMVSICAAYGVVRKRVNKQLDEENDKIFEERLNGKNIYGN